MKYLRCSTSCKIDYEEKCTLIPPSKKQNITNIVKGFFHYNFSKPVYLNCRETEGVLREGHFIQSLIIS